MIMTDLSRAELEKMAREALTRPPSYINYDERLYNTHGAIIGWADRGDDVLTESNYLMALQRLEGVIAHTDGEPDDVLDSSARHWLVGTLRTIFVRVYTEDGSDFTPAFREACAILASLDQYPILDESDYSDREYTAWEAMVVDGLGQAAYEHSYDSPAEQEAFIHLVLVTDRESLPDDVGYGPDEVSYSKLAELYERARNDHFEWLAVRCNTERLQMIDDARRAAGEVPFF